MIGLIISIVIIIVGTWLIQFLIEDSVTTMIFGFGSALFMALIAFGCVIPLTGGLYEKYGIVRQTGYITNLSFRGVVYKTYEGELQKGVGEQATAEENFKFSATDPKVVTELQYYLGSKRRVQLECKQWFCMPFKNGDTDREVIKISEVLEGG